MEIDFLQTPRLQALQEQAQAATQESEKRQFISQMVAAIVDAINKKTIDTIESGVDVNNLDEIQASLRNELTKATKPIAELLKSLNLSTQEQTKVTSDIQTKLLNKFAQYQTVVVKRVNDVVSVDNFDDIEFPTEVSILNLKDLSGYFQDLSNKISALELSVNLPAPQVTVQPTPVNIPQTIIPEVNLDPIIKELERGLKLLRTNNKSNPLAVRLTDGGEWIKELQTLNKSAAQTTQFMSDVSYIRDVNGLRISPATAEGQLPPSGIGDGSQVVTTAGTRVQLSATTVSCRYVILVGKTANTGKVFVGGTTVSSSSGRPLNPEQSEKIEINDLSKIWIDSEVNGEGVVYTYVA